MEIFFPHEIIFTNKNKVSVTDVANSLLANEQLLLGVGKVLEFCFDGLTVEKINVEFVSASTTSPLKEALAAGILVAFQSQLTTEIPRMIKVATGVEVSGEYKTVVTVIFLAIAIYGIEKAWEIFKNSKNERDGQQVPSQIRNNYGTIVNIGGDLIGVSPAHLSAAVSHAFAPKLVPHLAKMALQFIAPAKRERGAAIIGAGLSIEAETIAEAPSQLDIAMNDDDEKQTPLTNVEVVIHATDLDHSSSGWAGHITGVYQKRLRMKLFSSVQPSQLFGKDKIIADIILVSKRTVEGDYIPYLFHVINVY